MLRGFARYLLGGRHWLAMLALVILCVLIAAFGPSLTVWDMNPLASLMVRVLLILALVALWLAVEIIRYWRRRRTEAKVLDALVEDAGSPLAADDALDARQRLEEVLHALRDTGHAGRIRHDFVYRLPWFLVVATDSADIDALVEQSDLEMPLEAELGRSGAAGRVNGSHMRWWLTEQAVLIGTQVAGDDGYGVGSGTKTTWRGILTFLHQHRPRRPLDGIVLAVPAASLTSGAWKRSARRLGEMLAQASLVLGAQLQVYVVVTEADQLMGFKDFFDGLDEENREQPLGVALPASAAAPGDLQARLAQQVDQLVAALGRMLPFRTAATRDVTRRSLMTILPEQMARLAKTAQAFTSELSRTKQPRQGILLRGLFFTGLAVPNATTMDGWQSFFAQEIGLDGPARGSQRVGRSFFTTGLLRDFVFKEAGLSGRSPEAERRTLAIHLLGYAGSLLLLAGLVTPSWLEFVEHKATLRAMKDAAGQEQQLIAALPPIRTLNAILPVLDQARYLSRLDVNDTIATRMVGFSPLDIKTARLATHEHYHRMLRDTLLPLLAGEVANELRRVVNSGNAELIRSLLRVYLMLGDPSHYQQAEVQAWTNSYISASFPFDAAQRTAASQHVEQLFRLMPQAVELDMSLVGEARMALRQRPSAETIYAHLKDDALRSGLSPLDVVAALGPAGAQLLMLRTQAGLPVQVPAFYTRDGFYQVFLTQLPALVTASSDDWVLGKEDAPNPAEAAGITRQVTAQYVRDYVKQWQTVIEQISLPAMPDLSSLAGSMQTLAAADSPIVQLLALIKEQTDLPLPAAPPTLAGKALGAASAMASKAGVPGAVTNAALAETGATADPFSAMFTDQKGAKAWPGDAIAAPFKPLVALVDVQNGQAPVLRVQGVLSSAYGVVSGIASGQNPQAAPDLLAKVISGQGADPLIGLRVQAASAPRPIDGILRDLYQNTWNLLLQATLEKIQAAWTRNVAPVCQEAIGQRYPFVDGADNTGRDVMLQDFASFFGPGGTMDKFVTDNLALFTVSQADGALVPASQNGLSLGISQQALAQINRARRFRDLFFSGDGNLLLKFWLTPRYLDPRATTSTLTIDQTSLTYRHEPPRETALKWPGDGDGGASLTLMGIDALPVTTSASGPWALFRLLDQSAKIQNAGGQLAVNFTINNLTAAYTLRTSSVVNPFINNDFRNFRCVPRL